MIDEWSGILPEDNSPYDSIYKTRRRGGDDRRHRRNSKKTSERKNFEAVSRSRPRGTHVDEIPSAVNESWFDPLVDPEEPPALALPKKTSRKETREKSHNRVLTTTTAHAAAIVPVEQRGTKTRRVRRPRDQLGEKIQTWWNPSVVGKRQRLPVLDWRKGEKYNRAPDGTVIGKEGFDKLVFDDTIVKNRKRQSGRGNSAETTAASDNDDYVEKKRRKEIPSSERRKSSQGGDSRPRRSSTTSSRRSSISTTAIVPVAPIEIPDYMMPGSGVEIDENATNRPLLNGWDYMQKNPDGVYSLGKFQIISRREDRAWSEQDNESGFIMSPSISCEAGFVAEMILMPKMPPAPVETLDQNQALFVQILRAASNSIQVKVNGSEDVMYIDSGSSYSITNISQEHRAVLSITFIRNDEA
jgi:hypothetical protein